MQYTIKEAAKSTGLNNSMVSIPECFSGNKLNKDLEFESCLCQTGLQGNTIIDMWNQQHPLIHTWLLLSFLSIGILYALFFIVL